MQVQRFSNRMHDPEVRTRSKSLWSAGKILLTATSQAVISVMVVYSMGLARVYVQICTTHGLHSDNQGSGWELNAIVSYLMPVLSPSVVLVLFLISHANTGALTRCWSRSLLGFSFWSGQILIIIYRPPFSLCNQRCAASRINHSIRWTLINYELSAHRPCPFSAPRLTLSAPHCALLLLCVLSCYFHAQHEL